jgi:ABC-type multidrug transport system fused ATPase/permease subunit
LALLLTRLYAPLTALANARVEIASALVSFERVFEVVDLVPLIREKPDAVALPDGPVSVEFDDVRFSYRRPTRCRWRRSKRLRCSTSWAETKCCMVFRSRRSRGRWWHWSARRGPASRRSRL